MGKELKQYDIFPRIIRANSKVTLTIRPLFDHVRFQPGQVYALALVPAEGITGQVTWSAKDPQYLYPENNELKLACQFFGEQEYILLLVCEGKVLAEFRLFALEDDLFERRPFKGDFHMHTHHSDGKESPAYVAASCRRIGLDFMAITDHRQYAPSLEAIQAFALVESDFRIYPGEEVHPPENPVHILNFGGQFSVNELFKLDNYQDEVQAVADQLSDFPQGVDRYTYASCVWCYQKIREGGGLGVFCHPYWLSQHRYDVPVYLTDLLFERQPYDALEVIGGYHSFEVESNMLQVARYHDERSKGKHIPIVGVSDSHGCETGSLFGWYYTVVFAASTDLPDLIRNIKDLYSVAVEALPGETARAHGPFRLVRYTQFLLREVFPTHDELCQEEGRLMLAYASGDAQAANILGTLNGRIKRLYDHWWS